MKEIVKFHTLDVSIEEKNKILEKVNELRRKRNYDQYYLDFFITYNYFTYSPKSCELGKTRFESIFKENKFKKVNPVEYFLKTNDNNFENKVDRIFEDTRETLLKKHADYGNENLKKYGEKGIIIRLSDKMTRLDNVYKGAEMQTDSHKDTYMDIIGYAVQALILLENKKNNQK